MSWNFVSFLFLPKFGFMILHVVNVDRQPHWPIGNLPLCESPPQNSSTVDVVGERPPIRNSSIVDVVEDSTPTLNSSTVDVVEDRTPTRNSSAVDAEEVKPRDPLQEYLSQFPTTECKTHWYPAGSWTRRATEVAVSDRPVGQQMFGSIPAQHAIWRHQHPSTCYDKKFLVARATGQGHGIGSVLHVATTFLQAALDLDRILVLWPQPGQDWLRGSYCDGTDTLDDCYFEPLSSCTIYDVFGNVTFSDALFDTIPWLDWATYTNNSYPILRDSVSGGKFLYHDTPKMFHELLRSGNISPQFFYWWRAQGATYIVRPNRRTLRELERRRIAIFDGGAAIEPGTISVHVRHGDKWKESKLASDETFLQKTEELLLRQPDVLKRKIFLSTEDPNTVKFFANLSDWSVQYTNVTRDGSDPNMSPEQFASRIGWTEEFLNSLLSLQLALECDGFVGMIGSNWNRLIDELRSTIRCNYHRIYNDVDQGFQVTDFNW